MRTVTRAAIIVAATATAAATAASPAFAGQAYPAPGFPSSNASCVGAALNFQAHYGGDGQGFPVITHGAVGPNISGHATTDGPGAVGEFNSTLAKTSGPIWECLP
jgi:hypothetical protein